MTFASTMLSEMIGRWVVLREILWGMTSPSSTGPTRSQTGFVHLPTLACLLCSGWILLGSPAPRILWWLKFAIETYFHFSTIFKAMILIIWYWRKNDFDFEFSALRKTILIGLHLPHKEPHGISGVIPSAKKEGTSVYSNSLYKVKRSEPIDNFNI